VKITPIIQLGGRSEAVTIKTCLEQRLMRADFDRVQIASAYVSVAGARVLLGLCSQFKDIRCQWLVGLDDCVTQPGAIDLLRGLSRSELKVAALGARPLRFHPKVWRFSSSRVARELLLVGSANLTSTALAGNSEAVLLLEATSKTDRQLAEDVWKRLWSQGHKPDDVEIASYRQIYEQARPLRQQMQRLQGAPAVEAVRPTDPVIERDSAELDPENAGVCWIECGAVTAMGRELELKAEQGLFFGLDSRTSDEGHFTFRVSSGATVPLRMKYQENHMWRLQMNNDVPEVRAGLRPRLPNGRLGRSEYVAVFTRTEQSRTYGLSFLHQTSAEFAELRNRSQQLGTIGFTTATNAGRMYGWC
jgi:HKD family nuclease